jgi:hypothetical protein
MTSPPGVWTWWWSPRPCAPHSPNPLKCVQDSSVALAVTRRPENVAGAGGEVWRYHRLIGEADECMTY